jgi:hypothetical protein
VHRLGTHSKRATRLSSSDRLLTLAEESRGDTSKEVATALDRQVSVLTDLQDSIAHDSVARDIASHPAEGIARLHFELRRTLDLNREMTDRNRRLAYTDKFLDSVKAPEPLLGEISELDLVDWILWFKKYSEYKKKLQPVKNAICYYDASR